MDSLLLGMGLAVIIMILVGAMSVRRSPPQVIYVMQTEPTQNTDAGCLTLILIGVLSAILFRGL